ncbi:hypothetical protein BJ875DRAFT_454499 [Amylocarpus encephaloides]|uniref:Cupin type-2 domain-containing protein n=1 Tax=Amylocarpus encephaloides TaxID=45428 RepID=A0A9P7YP03_9HELO|nr:hypothetical protein BJ875DRAFT_454499 [Amylocarpus encephaloides]
MTSPFPPTRLLTTGHRPDGTSIFTHDSPPPSFQPFGPSTTAFTSFHSSLVVPVSNTAPFPDLSCTLPRCPPSGVLFCTTDFAPGGKAPMHRTLSIDYIMVIVGEIVVLLDGGEEKVLKAGDAMVQRGTNHSWENRGEGWAKMVFVMVGSEEIKLADGRVLGDSQFDASKR